jgi:hypothetical protein
LSLPFVHSAGDVVGAADFQHHDVFAGGLFRRAAEGIFCHDIADAAVV